MTAEELRQFPGYENQTDEQTEETLQVLEELADLFIGLYQTKREVLEQAISEKKGNQASPEETAKNEK